MCGLPPATTTRQLMPIIFPRRSAVGGVAMMTCFYPSIIVANRFCYDDDGCLSKMHRHSREDDDAILQGRHPSVIIANDGRGQCGNGYKVV